MSVTVRTLFLLTACAALLWTGACVDRGEANGPSGGGPGSSSAERTGARQPSGDSRGPAVEATEEDWRILRRTLLAAESQGLDTVSVGEAVAGVALHFVGTPYRPQTLEVPGPERLVVNLRALDCVTLVETALAMARTLREPGSVSEWPEARLRSTYADALRTLRYRSGELSGYPSRLHYFSEWIRDAEAKGLVENVTEELGGVPDPEPVNFMSGHPESYRQLADTGVLAQIRRTEERISREPRIYIPEDRIADVASGIETGDVIAATSTVEGLDVAHTGIALWRDGTLRLLHAPLVGDSVQVSPRSLARRIQDIGGQDGIMVARPVDPSGSPGVR